MSGSDILDLLQQLVIRSTVGSVLGVLLKAVYGNWETFVMEISGLMPAEDVGDGEFLPQRDR